MKSFSKENLLQGDASFRRDFVNALSGYKSLNLIGTISKANETNLAPFSQVFHIGASPPLVGVLFRPHTVERHTLQNILDTAEFTLNHVAKSFYEKAHQTAARYEVSEFEAVGLEVLNRPECTAPFVKISPLQIACKLISSQTLDVNDTVLIIASIEHVWVVDGGLREDGSLDLEKMETVTVNGLDEYYIGKRLGKLSYPKPGKEVEKLL
ncbi:flavin reductase family protein [Belliella kenyensis]|uniref:Flavin reductase family protein n=1 Tax=Belliella kenyensis TaxID=1472724 RepID=A0ABV8EH77_9BACT|nr:flavin reductase [Belliella kenyensis]MCH7403093.1 flavin reductase [Belliella kenyensis]MDN3602262.1 flavin reductase [Belliella kenyensis]